MSSPSIRFTGSPQIVPSAGVRLDPGETYGLDPLTADQMAAFVDQGYAVWDVPPAAAPVPPPAKPDRGETEPPATPAGDAGGDS